MELFMLISGVVLLWKFSSSINSVATSARVKTEVMAEEVIAECVQQRTENFEQWKADMEGKEVKTHDEIMKMFKVNK